MTAKLIGHLSCTAVKIPQLILDPCSKLLSKESDRDRDGKVRISAKFARQRSESE